MKIKIKSREEIEKTLLGRNHRYNLSCYFSPKMFDFCDKIFNATPSLDLAFSFTTPPQEGMNNWWCWHKDWCEVVEDFSEEDCFIIAELDEMLNYFLGEK